MDTSKTYSFLAACRDYFGLKPGQTGVAFLQETKALTEEDKAEIRAGLVALGYSIEVPKA
jgi:hypothetical protein